MKDREAIYYRFDPMQVKIRGKDLLQHRNVKQISTYSIVLCNGVSKLDTFIVRRPINTLIIKQMRKILIQEFNKLFNIDR